ncbi:MAG: RNA-binding protein [Candidatus Wallbacteria bacterium]|nr:RNA-binding protein [Candidatus Wallbacteria bacterium]
MNTSKLYVGNLSYSVTSRELTDLFSPHGTVKDVKVIEGKGFGFVEMGSPTEAEAAKNALNNQEFSGRQLKIDEAKPPKPRSDFGGGGGGGRRGGRY